MCHAGAHLLSYFLLHLGSVMKVISVMPAEPEAGVRAGLQS